MAISQSHYIDITSGTSGNANVTERILAGLVFTKSTVKSGNTEVTDVPVSMTLDEVVTCFGASAAETAFATKYFAYASANGNSPTSISFAHYGDSSETPLAAITRINGVTNNFGSFCFIETLTDAEIIAVANYNAGLNYKYLYVVQDVNGSTAAVTSALVTALTGISGVCVIQCTTANTHEEYMPMAIFAATDYDGTNTATNFMYKQFASAVVEVTTDSIATLLDSLNVNYYGQTQTNGKTIAFFQRGFNMDGLDTAVYCNEIWLKSRIETLFFNLMTSLNKISADENGAQVILTGITEAATQGLTNGTIIIGKSLTSAQKAAVTAYSGDNSAWNSVQSSGYWLNVVIKLDGQVYKAVYTLIYSKGDSIRKVEGYDILI